MACLTNYTVQCVDVSSGRTGCFLFDTAHWQTTGEFRAVSPVFSDLSQFYAWNNANGRPGGPCYLARVSVPAAQRPSQKPVHGAPKLVNVPRDMVRESPVPCAFKVGDPVVFTNEYGVKFDLTVRGFAETVHDCGRFVYVFTDAWWFPVEPSTLSHRASKGGAM